jgi:hypothetical protein
MRVFLRDSLRIAGLAVVRFSSCALPASWLYLTGPLLSPCHQQALGCRSIESVRTSALPRGLGCRPRAILPLFASSLDAN